jgi:hypothetical protein
MLVREMPRRRAALIPPMRGVLILAVVACSGSKVEQRAPTSPDLELGDLGGRHATPPPADAAVAVTPPMPGTPPQPVPSGLDFATEVQLLYRIAACGGADAGRVPPTFPKADKAAPIVERHCKNILERIGQFRADYFEKHRGWFIDHVPNDAPKTVVYPFGGGDLLSALVAFPDATEITTISLELSGDPRRITTLDPNRLSASLGAMRVEIGGLLSVGSNTSVNLSAQQRNELPGQVVSFLIGLVAAGFEPTAMRYFALDDTGAIRYHDQASIDVVERKRGKPLKGDWVSPSFSEAFSHVEITYQRPGETQLRVHRHFGWNLADDYLTQHPQLLRHLAAKGKVTVLVKGASYLLQRPNFSQIRNYLLAHLAWMLSDSTGIAPTYAAPAGMVQETFGHYSGAFLEGGRANKHDQSFIDLWRRNPRKKLGFRFGYVDAGGAAHLVVTRPK